DDLIYTLNFNSHFRTNLAVDLDLPRGELELELNIPNFTVTADLRGTLKFGVNLTDQTFFILEDPSRPDFTIDAIADVRGITASGRFGPFKASIDNGSAHLNASLGIDLVSPAGS